MKRVKETVLYFHDYMTDENETKQEVKALVDEFRSNGIEFEFGVSSTEVAPFQGESSPRSYDILLFDWGGASMGNDMLGHYCKRILKEAIDNPNRVYVMASKFTLRAMKEAQESFNAANGGLPHNVFLTVSDACEYLNKLYHE